MNLNKKYLAQVIGNDKSGITFLEHSSIVRDNVIRYTSESAVLFAQCFGELSSILKQANGIERNNNIISFFTTEGVRENIKSILMYLKKEDRDLYNLFIYSNKIDPNLVDKATAEVFLDAIFNDDIIYREHLKDFTSFLKGDNKKEIQNRFSGKQVLQELFDQTDYLDDLNQDHDGGFGDLNQEHVH